MFGSSISTRGNLQRKDLGDFDSTGSSFDLSFQSDHGQQPTMKDTLLVSLRSEELCLMSLTLIIKWCFTAATAKTDHATRKWFTGNAWPSLAPPNHEYEQCKSWLVQKRTWAISRGNRTVRRRIAQFMQWNSSAARRYGAADASAIAEHVGTRSEKEVRKHAHYLRLPSPRQHQIAQMATKVRFLYFASSKY